MRVAGAWLMAADLQRLMAALSGAGHGVFVVGGALRNALMGRAIADIDLATSAQPAAVMDTAARAGFRVVPTGLDHGTVTIVGDNAAYEVTTFRRDTATDGRHATVVFTDDLAQDAARRDFTMNALYADAAGDVMDPMGGIADITAGRLRFVGDPAARVREDYLRILRYFRFSAIYANPDHGFDPEVLAVFAAHLDGLQHLSKERIGQEMRKLLAAVDPAPALAAMAATGVLARILPGCDARFVAPLVHLESGNPRGWLARLALLGGENTAAALRLSRAEAGILAKICAEMADGLTAAALAWRHSMALGGDIIHARAAMMGQPVPPDWAQDLARGAKAQCPVCAADFMPDLAGPALGQALGRATRRWLDSDLHHSKADLLRG